MTRRRDEARIVRRDEARIVRPRRSRDVVQVHVPDDQASLFHIPGPHGGWFASLLYGHQSIVDVPMRELCELLAGSRGEVIVARRLTSEELATLESRRLDCDTGVHASIIRTEEARFRRPRRRDKQGRKRGDARTAAAATPRPVAGRFSVAGHDGALMLTAITGGAP